VKKKRVPVLTTTTTATMEDARKIASTLVEGRLAACVQIIDPITSVYTWQGSDRSFYNPSQSCKLRMW